VSARFDVSTSGQSDVAALARVLLRLPSQRPQKGRQALRDVIGEESWAGADDDYDRAVFVTPAAFTWKRALRNLVELPALWTTLPLLGRDPGELAESACAILRQHGAALPPFAIVDDVTLTLLWAIEPLRRPKEGRPEFHFRCFEDQLVAWRYAAIKLSYAFEPLGARPLDMALADEALLGFVPLPPPPGAGLVRHAAELGLSPARLLPRPAAAAAAHAVDGAVVDGPVRIAAVSKPLRRFDERLFLALGRAPLHRGRRRWRDSEVTQAAQQPQPAGARHPAAVKLACAHRWDGLGREESLAALRAWAATCERDGAFPARAGQGDELEALVDWTCRTLQPGGPTPRRDAPGTPRRRRRRTSRDHVAAAVCGFLSGVGGAFSGSLVELGQRAALWALDHGVDQPVPLRTLKRAVVDLVALGELAHDVVRAGATWCSAFVLRAVTPSSSSPGVVGLRLASSAPAPLEKTAGAVQGSIASPQGQQAKSMWGPVPAPALFVETDRGGSGGAFPLEGGSGGDSGDVSSTPAAEAAAPASGPPEVFEDVPSEEQARELSSSVATRPDAGVQGSRASGGSLSSPRQRRLPLPRASSREGGAVRRGRGPGRAPGEGLPPLDDAVVGALADVGRHLSGADHRALLEEARAGLFARPRVLGDFVGALRRRALRLLRLREIALASAAHVEARRRAEAREEAREEARAQAQAEAQGRAQQPQEPARAALDVLADFRRLLAAQVKPLHERTVVERARRLQGEGLSLLVLPPRSKQPSSSWKAQQTERWSLRRLEQGLEPLGPEAGLAIVCGEVSGIVVADLDDEDAVFWARAHLPDTPWKTRTSRGEHWYFRLPPPASGVPFAPPSSLPWKGELRAAGHYVVAPGSWHPDGGRYEALGDWSVARERLPLWPSSSFSSSSSSSSSVEVWRGLRAKVLKGL
jgi:hypothetical protein